MTQPQAPQFLVERLTPERVLTATSLLWVVLYIVTPVTGVYPADVTPYIVMGLSLLGFYVGFATFNRRPLPPQPIYTEQTTIETFFNLCLFLGFVGLALRSVDWFVFRNVEISAGIFENRDALTKSGGAIAVAAAALTPFNLASTIFAVVGARTRRKIPYAWLSYLGSAYWIFMNTLIGSRSAMLFFLCTILVVYLLVAPRLSGRQIRWIVLSVIAAFVVFSAIFIYRIQQSGATIELISQYSGFTSRVPLDKRFLKVLSASSGWWSFVLFSLSTAAQYYLHGVFEALYVIDVKHTNFDFGAYQFELVPKAMNGLFGVPYDAQALEDSAVETGVYLTFIGPAYIDFSYGAPLFCLFFGAVASLARRAVRAGNILALPFYTTMLVVIAVVPVGSLLVGGVGLFNLVSLFGLWWFGSLSCLRFNETAPPRAATA
jgi:oligosaccharide repeat unit polymerase